MKGCKFVVWGIVTALALLVLCSISYAGEVVAVYVNGEKVEFPDQQPFVDEATGRTYVPVRFVSEALGARVVWNEAGKQIIIFRNDGKAMSLVLGSRKISINGIFEELDAPPLLVNGRVMVPLRFVSEKLRANVEWNNGIINIIDTEYVEKSEILARISNRIPGAVVVQSPYGFKMLEYPKGDWKLHISTFNLFGQKYHIYIKGAQAFESQLVKIVLEEIAPEIADEIFEKYLEIINGAPGGAFKIGKREVTINNHKSVWGSDITISL